MPSTLIIVLFNLLSHLPLSLLHRLGSALGWITYGLSVTYARRLRENLRNAYKNCSDTEFRHLLRANIAEAGKNIAELPWIWCRPLDQVAGKVKQCEGWEHLEAARQQGKSLIILSPHIGGFEIIPLYLGYRMTMTTLYRVPKLAWLDRLIHAGRERGNMKLAKADTSGVRSLLKALKNKEIIGIAPDQVPGNGEGEWAPFFGHPAYTMTLAGRLAETSRATVLLTYCERLPDGEGYIMRMKPLTLIAGVAVTQQLNAALEDTIRACPAQYLWSYNRYKVPRGVQPPAPTGAA